MILPFQIPQADIATLALMGQIAMASRAPDEVLTHPLRGPYLQKWRIKRDDDGSSICVHRFLRSDGDLELHDHPWNNCTIMLEGGYWEVTRDARHWVGPGMIRTRKAGDFHRIELAQGIVPITLFSHGPKTNDWGFLHERGFKIPAHDFVLRG